MSGPFTMVEASIIFDSHFHSSPVGLVEKIPGNGIWCMIHHLSKCDENVQSTNGWIDSDDFPTTYFAASWVCQFVSSSLWPHMGMLPFLFGGHTALAVRWA